MRRSYDALAPTYDTRWRRYIEATLNLASEPLELNGDERVLDVACGTGELQRRLTGHWPELKLIGADLSLNMLRQASAKGLLADWLAADSTRLPFVDAWFDCTICVNAFHYFRRPAESLAEMRRVLRRSGTLVLVDWCDDYRSCKLCSAWLKWTDPAFHRTYSLTRCRQQLEAAGFQMLSARRRRIDWLWGLMSLVCRAR